MQLPISIDVIVVLDAIARKKSFSLAAHELHRVPSALTYTIQKTEKELGVVLIERNSHKAVLTEAGKAFLEDGKSILVAIQDLVQKTKQVFDGCEREFRIAVDSLLPLEMLYPILQKFQNQFPFVKISLLEEVFGGSWDALYTERADLVVGAPGSPPGGYRYKTRTLGFVDFVFAASPFHPICKHKQPLKAETLEKYIAIVAADSSLSLASQSAGVLDKQIALRVPTVKAKIQAQIEGLGIGFLPKHLIQQELKDKKLLELKVALQRDKTELFLAWNSQNQGKALNWFLAELEKAQVYEKLLKGC